MFKNSRLLILVAAILLSLYVFLPQSDRFRDSFEAVGTIQPHFIALGLLLSTGTYFVAAEIYCLIAFHPLRYRRTLLVQIASSFTNRLLPAGAGGIATSVRYLLKHKHTKVQAGSVAALNNIIGIVSHLTILMIILLVVHTRTNQSLRVHIPPLVLLFGILIIISGITILVFMSSWRKALRRGLRLLRASARVLWHKPWHLAGALGCAMVITSLNTLTLWVCVQAFGAHLSLAQVYIVLTVGVVAASITPTPGGIGGAEAGLVASLVSFGVPTEPGLSIALAYRFLTYWLPLIPGFIYFQYALKKKYI